eukprot:EG_transcript_13980
MENRLKQSSTNGLVHRSAASVIGPFPDICWLAIIPGSVALIGFALRQSRGAGLPAAAQSYMAMAATVGRWPKPPQRLHTVLCAADSDVPERPIDPDELNTSMVRVVSETVSKYSNNSRYEVPTATLDRVRAALNELKKGGAYELGDFAKTMADVVRSEVERLGTSPADWEGVGVEVESLVALGVVKFTGKEEYEAGDVSREAARRVKALVANAQQLSALVKDTVREYTGKDHYEFGDLTVALDQRVKDAVAGLLEKDSYEVGDLTRVIDKVVKQEIETVTGRPYQFGDLSRALGSRLQGAVSGFTGKEDYRPGDLLREAGKRLTGRADYQVGDLTKGLLSNLFKKKDP